MSDSGPFYYPGCDDDVCVVNECSRAQLSVADFDNTSSISSEGLQQTRIQVIKTKRPGNIITQGTHDNEETKVERDYTHIDFENSNSSEYGNSPKKNAESPGDKKKKEESKKVKKSSESKKILNEEIFIEASRKTREKEAVMNSLHVTSSSRQTETLNSPQFNILHDTSNATVSEKITREGLRISHILKIEKMAKIGESFVERRSRRESQKTSDKTRSGSKRCTEIQLMSSEKGCRVNCSIQ